MSNIDINSLLEKYWNAETTLEEEQIIQAHFANQETNSPISQYFQVLKDESKITAPNLSKFNKSTSPKTIVLWTRWRALAAILVLGVAAMFLFKPNGIMQDQRATVVEIEDPEEALKYTKMALAMVSKNYTKGTTDLTNSMGKVNKLNIIK